jgi:hypothetical protein
MRTEEAVNHLKHGPFGGNCELKIFIIQNPIIEHNGDGHYCQDEYSPSNRSGTEYKDTPQSHRGLITSRTCVRSRRKTRYCWLATRSTRASIGMAVVTCFRGLSSSLCESVDYTGKYDTPQRRSVKVSPWSIR